MRAPAFAAVAAFVAGAAVAATPITWTTVETTHLGADTLAVQTSDGSDDSPRLVVTGPGGQTSVVSLNGGLALAKNAMTTQALAAQNKLASQYLYATSALNDAGGQPLLVVFGAAEDPDPFAIRVLDLTANGGVQTLFSADAFELTAVADLNKDGVPELIGRPSWGQMDTTCLSTYDPLAVYRLSTGKYAYDAALSEAYNKAHYVWAGPKSREDIAVDTCHKPGPILAKVPKSS